MYGRLHNERVVLELNEITKKISLETEVHWG